MSKFQKCHLALHTRTSGTGIPACVIIIQERVLLYQTGNNTGRDACATSPLYIGGSLKDFLELATEVSNTFRAGGS